MIKKIKVLILAVMLILACMLPVNAADATVTLKPSATELYPGDTFTVTVYAKCEEGINGIEGLFSYDEDKLELIEKDVEGVKIKIESLNPLKWYNLGEGLKFEVAYGLDSGSATEGDIVKGTFKVKDTAPEGSKAKVTVSNIVLDSDAATNSTKEVGTKEVEVSIIEKPTNSNPGETPGENDGDEPGEEDPWGNPEGKTLTGIEVSSNATKIEYNAGDKFEKAGLTVKAKYSDGSSKEITDYKITNGDKLEIGQTSVTISYTENGVTKTTTQAIKVIGKATNSNKEDNKSDFEDIKEDNTKTENKMPNTGYSSVIGIMLIIAVFGVVCLVKYNKYKGI